MILKKFMIVTAVATALVGAAVGFTACKDNTVDDGHEHTYEWHVSKEATCEEDGERQGKCTICGDEKTEKITRGAHKLEGEITVTKEPTCMAEGEGTQVCSVCHTPQPVTIPKAAHTLEYHEGIEAACNKDGMIEYWHCTVCERNFTDEAGTIDAANLTIAKETVPHHYVDGICSVCQAQDPNAPHKCVPTKVEEVPSTCKEQGVGAHWKCPTCGKLYLDEAATQETTLEQLALEISSNHGGSINAVHYYEVPAKDCATYGKKDRYDCKVCGKHFKDEELTQEYQTVGEDGICTDDTLENPKKAEHANGKNGTWNSYGHRDENNETGKVEPTCTSVGWTESVIVCNVCGGIFRENDFDTSTSTLKATATDKDGKEYVPQPLDRKDVEIPIDPTKHSENPQKHLKANPTSCGSANVGYKNDCWECTYCHKIFEDEHCKTELEPDEILNYGAHGKMTESGATNSTCTEHGHPQHWTCDSCQEHFGTATPSAETLPLSDEEFNLEYAPHDFSELKANSQGHWYICSVCGTPDADEDGNPHIEEHEFDEDSGDDTCYLCGFGSVDYVKFFNIVYDNEQSPTEGYITGFAKDDKGEYYFAQTDETILRIPEHDRLGVPITKIMDWAFSPDRNLAYRKFVGRIEEFYIPATVTEVGVGIFCEFYTNFSGIKRVEFERSSSTPVKIGSSILAGQDELRVLILPKVMEKIPEQIAYCCTNLTTVQMPDKITTRGTSLMKTFMNCYKLKEIDLWCFNGLNFSLGGQAFLNCESLQTVYIPKGCTSLDAECMSGCISMQTINYGGTEQDWRAISKTQDNTYASWNYGTAVLQSEDLVASGILHVGYSYTGTAGQDPQTP